jgi:FtsP/CotA-like multicopper oxidase with cupredoxin domain
VNPSFAFNPSALIGDIIHGQMTRVRVKFNNPGLFQWNASIAESQDHEMIRPMVVLP